MQDEITLLNSQIFKSLSKDEIKALMCTHNIKIVNLNKNQLLFKEGDKPCYMYLLLEGALSIFRNLYSGRRSIIRSFENIGELFMEMYLFLENKNYEYSGCALKDNTRVLLLPKSLFESSVNQKVLKNLLNVLASRAFSFNQKLQILSGNTLKSKIANILLNEVQRTGSLDISLTYSREDLADFLSVARPSLSRELINLKDEGLIDFKGNKFKILDIDALEDYS